MRLIVKPEHSVSSIRMKRDVRLTRRELDIMSVLWEAGEATVNEIRDRIDPALAYTGVSTMVRLLELKGYVAHRRGKGKTHLYFAAINAEAAGASALDRVLEKIYGGSPTKLLAHLVEKNRPTETELDKMRALLKRPDRAR